MRKMKLTVTSFGYKHGNIPINADVILNARCLNNPYRNLNLRFMNGLESKIKDNVRASTQYHGLMNLAGEALEMAIRHDRKNFHIAVGCTAGKHRSVVMAEDIARDARTMEGEFREVVVVHQERDSWPAKETA